MFALLHLCDCHYFIVCSGRALIGSSCSIYFPRFGRWHFFIEFGLLFLVSWDSSRYGLLGLHVRTFAFCACHFVCWPLVANMIMRRQSELKFYTCLLSGKISLCPCLFIDRNLSSTVQRCGTTDNQ